LPPSPHENFNRPPNFEGCIALEKETAHSTREIFHGAVEHIGKKTVFVQALTRSHLKNRILAQGQGRTEFQPTGILKYVEDLKRGPNTEIGEKDFFEIASSVHPEMADFGFRQGPSEFSTAPKTSRDLRQASRTMSRIENERERRRGPKDAVYE